MDALEAAGHHRLDASENEIRADVAAGLDLAAVQEKRKCGSSCGS
jgi:bacterioferritin-associated ferredoxin